MQNLYKSRYSILLFVILLYLIPITLLSSYGKLYMPAQKGWNLLAFGLFFSSMGSLGLFWVLCRLSDKNQSSPHGTEEEMNKISPIPFKQSSNIIEVDTTQAKALDELQEQYLVLQEELKASQLALQNQVMSFDALRNDYEQLQKQIELNAQDYERNRQSLWSEIEQQKKLLNDSQKTISEQREGIDKKLQQIALLETKVSDLTYEIKTLIQLAEIENQSVPLYSSLPLEGASHSQASSIDLADDEIPLPEKQVKNEYQAAIQLKRCIDIAQKITGASHYNNSNSRFKELAVDNYTLDLRRLFESLRMENASVIVFYSQKENKILFVNNQSRNLLGWSPDKFIQSFQDIVDSKELWKQSISSLAIKNDVQVSLKMKSKSGPLVEVQALLGIIPTGIFRHHILGVLYQKTNEDY